MITIRGLDSAGNEVNGHHHVLVVKYQLVSNGKVIQEWLKNA